MLVDDIRRHLATRKYMFLQFRWLLFIWMGGALIWGMNQGGVNEKYSYLLLGVLAASQGLLWLVPLRHYEGLWMANSLFLFDLNLILFSLQALGQLKSELVTVIFLGIFIAALTQRVSLSILNAVVMSAIYLGLVSRGTDGFDFSACQGCFLNLPFLLISSMHAGLLAQEAHDESQAKKFLQVDKQMLSTRMQTSFLEAAEYVMSITLMLDTLDFALVMVDHKGMVKIFNTMAEYSFGLERIKVLNNPLERHAVLAPLIPAVRKYLENPDDDVTVLNMPRTDETSWFMNLRGLRMKKDGAEPAGVLLMLTPLSFKENRHPGPLPGPPPKLEGPSTFPAKIPSPIGGPAMV